MSCPQCAGPLRARVVRVRRSVTASLYIIGLLAAYALGGPYLRDVAEGLHRSQLPHWKVILPAAVLLLAVAAAFVRLRRNACARCRSGWVLVPVGDAERDSSGEGTSRRLALRALGAGGATVAAAASGFAAALLPNRGWVPIARELQRDVDAVAPKPRSDWRGATIKAYRRLGRTEARVSDIGLGSARIGSEGGDPASVKRAVDVARRAIDRGVNYFDTSPDYSATNSEQILGEAMRGRRDQMFLATKFCVAEGHLPNETPVPEIIGAVESSLRRLQTDYVDLIHIHSCDRLDRLMAPNIHEAFDRLRSQGKARFLGVSSHSPNLEEVANAAIESGRFDVIMLAYHYGMWPGFGPLLRKAKAHDIGVVAMKTLKGAMHTNLAEFRDERTSYAQAAFRWVLSNPDVSALVISFWNQQQVDEYIAASGAPTTSEDHALLERYDELTRGDYCQPHCGVCLPACPEQLAINDILRYRMYFRDYGWEKEGVRLYAELARNAIRCVSCNAPCAGVCPIAVPIRDKMLHAHALLTLPRMARRETTRA